MQMEFPFRFNDTGRHSGLSAGDVKWLCDFANLMAGVDSFCD